MESRGAVLVGKEVQAEADKRSLGLAAGRWSQDRRLNLWPWTHFHVPKMVATSNSPDKIVKANKPFRSIGISRFTRKVVFPNVFAQLRSKDQEEGAHRPARGTGLFRSAVDLCDLEAKVN